MTEPKPCACCPPTWRWGAAVVTTTSHTNRVSISPAAFARNFERALGQSPMQYLTDWRLTLARDYLLAGELTLGQIAERTGYSSPNAFAATFRRHVGLAPGQWRQQSSSKPQQVAPG